MRRLWTALVHGGNTRQAEDETSGVGGDPAPGYRWKYEAPDRDGDIYVRLQHQAGTNWKNVDGEWAMASRTLEVTVPEAKRKVWSRYKKKAELVERNQRWIEQNL